jgi:Domain of unknown function (DUF4760)
MNGVEIATIVASIAQTIALVFVVIQIKEMKEANFSSAFKTVYDVLQSDQIRNARNKVMEELRNKPFEEWDKNDKWSASQVCQSYDIAGIMIRNGLLPEKLVADSWGDSLRNCYPILKPYLDQIRFERNAGEYWDDFEWLCLQAPKYQKKIRPDN